MKLRTVKNIMDTSLLVWGAVTIVSLLQPTNEGQWYYISFTVVFLIAFIVFSSRYWRCPSCGLFLGRNEGQYCQHCGQSLYEE